MCERFLSIVKFSVAIMFYFWRVSTMFSLFNGVLHAFIGQITRLSHSTNSLPAFVVRYIKCLAWTEILDVNL